MATGKLFLISGPSGVGKKTVLDLVIPHKHLNLTYSISMTTREKRPQEVNGVDYYFVSQARFEQEIANNNMLEYAQFFHCYYGTPKDLVYQQLAAGKNVVLEIETIGAQQVMEQMPECISIFLIPPSLEVLAARLKQRNTESAEKIALRLKKAESELALQNIYKHVVCNDEVDHAAAQLIAIIEQAIQQR